MWVEAFLANVYSYNYTTYYKIKDNLIADANFTFSYFKGSQYEDNMGINY